MSLNSRMAPEKTAEMQRRTRERNLLFQAMKDRGASTVEELSQTTCLEKANVMRHLIALMQFNKVSIAGERNNQFIYCLVQEK